MVYRIPSLTDFEYKTPEGATVEAEESIKSIHSGLNATYVFKGWITEDIRKDIAYPGGSFDVERIHKGDPEKAFYVDDSIKLWDDCSENYPETEANPNIRDICIPGRSTKMVFTNWWDWLKKEYGAESAQYASWGPPLSMSATASVMSSASAPEAGYFFKLPIGTQLSVASNDNFKNIIQFDGATGTWKNSFSMDMWVKVSRDSMVVDETDGTHQTYSRTMREIANRDINSTVLFLANRSMTIQDFAKEDQKYADTGYDMYFLVSQARMYASNFDPLYNEEPSLNECMRTGLMASNSQQPGDLSAEWGNILYGWTYFAFSYDASTEKLVGYVKSNNADFKWEGNITDSGSQIIKKPAAHVPEVARNYGFLIGSNGITLVNHPELPSGHSFAWAPEMSVKCFRIYDRALSSDEFLKTWQLESDDFRPDKIRTRFNSLSIGADGDTLNNCSLYENQANTSPYMYTKVVAKNENSEWIEVDSGHPGVGNWNAMIKFPRQLSDYSNAARDRFLQKVPSSLFFGWTMKTEYPPQITTDPNDISKISAETIYNFLTYPEELLVRNNGTVISVGHGYDIRRNLCPVVLARAAYHRKDATEVKYYNYSCGRNLITAATSTDIGLPKTHNGGELQNYWTTTPGPYGSTQPPNYINLGGTINKWSKLSSFLYTSVGNPRPKDSPLHLYPVYKKEINVSPSNDYSWDAQYTSPQYQDIDVDVTLDNYQPFAGIHDTLLKDIQNLTANITLSTQTPNNKSRYISLLLSVNVDRGGGNHDTIYLNTAPLSHEHGQGEGKTDHSVTIPVPSNQSGNLNNVYLTLSARCKGTGSDYGGEVAHYKVLINFSKITSIKYE